MTKPPSDRGVCKCGAYFFEIRVAAPRITVVCARCLSTWREFEPSDEVLIDGITPGPTGKLPSYRYRDADKRRAYMKDWMRRKRARDRA